MRILDAKWSSLARDSVVNKTGCIGSIELSKNLKLLEQHPGRLEFLLRRRARLFDSIEFSVLRNCPVDSMATLAIYGVSNQMKSDQGHNM